MRSDPVESLSYKSPDSQFPSVEGRILSANAGHPSVKQDANPNSIVVLLTYFNYNIFLMGDATTLTESFILAWDKMNGKLTRLLGSASRCSRRVITGAIHRPDPSGLRRSSPKSCLSVLTRALSEAAASPVLV